MGLEDFNRSIISARSSRVHYLFCRGAPASRTTARTKSRVRHKVSQKYRRIPHWFAAREVVLLQRIVRNNEILSGSRMDLAEALPGQNRRSRSDLSVFNLLIVVGDETSLAQLFPDRVVRIHDRRPSRRSGHFVIDHEICRVRVYAYAMISDFDRRRPVELIVILLHITHWR